MNKNPETLKMMQELSDAIGPSGFEDEAVNTARKYVEDIARVEEDCLRNLYMYRNTNTGGKPVFMLDAHSDEVGFMVHSIKPNGTLRFVELGCLLYTSPSPRDRQKSRMPSSA